MGAQTPEKGTQVRTSDTIELIAPALALAQAKIEGAAKTATNPHLKNKYATLADVYDACAPALNSQGIAVLQTTEMAGAGGLMVITRLLHKSGQWIEGVVTMPVEKNTAQGIGSAYTYGRRYGLSALAGVMSEDDDDGNAASGQRGRQAPRPEPPPAPRSAADVSDSTLADLYLKAAAGGDEKKVAKIKAEAARRGLDLPELRDDPEFAQKPAALAERASDALPF